MKKYEFRPMTPADLDGMRALYAAAFKQQRSKEQDVWRWFETPFGLSPTIIAYDGSRCIASYTVWPVWIRMAGQRIKAAQSMDTMTHPDYQGQGLFPRLAIACMESLEEQGYKALYGFPNQLSFSGFLRHLNWAYIGDIPVWKTVTNRLNPVFSVATRLAKSASVFPKGEQISGAKWSDEPPDNEEQFVNLAIEKYQNPLDKMKLRRCRVDRNFEYLKWRYGASSGREYSWRYLTDDNNPEGFCIFRHDQDRLLITELLGTGPGLATMLRHLISHSRESGLRTIDILTNEPEIISALQNFGFMKRSCQHLIVRGLTAKTLPANIFNIDDWRITGGDFDVY